MMRFTVKTTYDQRGLTVMARTLRKTLRRRKSRRTRIFGGFLILLAAVVLVLSGWPFDLLDWVTLLMAVIIAATIATEDYLTGWFAGRKLLPGTEASETVFTSEEYVTTTSAAETHWRHEQVQAVYETADYFVLFLSDRHGQIFEKQGFTEGTVEDFRVFLERQTGKPVPYIK